MKKLLALFVSAIVALSVAGCTIVPVDATEPQTTYVYQDFTPAEKDLINVCSLRLCCIDRHDGTAGNGKCYDCRNKKG